MDGKKRRKKKHDDSVAQASDEKVIVACFCGKKYRVSSRRAGTSFECKLCGRDVHVDRENVSMRTRAAILGEIGIDADEAEGAYANERAVSTRRRRDEIAKQTPAKWRCAECGEPVADAKTAYRGEKGIVCDDCRAASVVHNDDDGREAAAGAKRTIDEWSTDGTKRDPRVAKVKGAGMAAFLFLGFSGLGGLFVGGLVASMLAPAVVAGAGGWIVWQQNKPA